MHTYPELLQEVKNRIRKAQVQATMSANAELLLMYWDVGRLVAARQAEKGWGTSIIPRLARDIRNELPEVKGFSERNIGRMLSFYKEYSELMPVALKSGPEEESTFLPPAVAKLQTRLPRAEITLVDYVLRLPWAHNIILLGVKDPSARIWYMAQTLEHGWSKNWLATQIKTDLYSRQGQAVSNFAERLPPPQSALAQEALKDPYIFDFLTLEEPFHERELEAGLVAQVEKFLLELGAGFAFMGRQYHLSVGEQDFYIDLLFYHTKLRCYVVIELKKGAFKPEYAGKLNFYCSVVDDVLRHEQDNPTIGLILCQSNDRIIAEYTLRDINKPIGISEFELTRILPENLKSSLPTVEELEQELDTEPQE